MGEKKHKENTPKLPGQSREHLFLCFFIEWLRGCTEGGGILLHVCGAPELFSCSKMSLFYLNKTCTP